jgi:hypothetical protein
MSSEITKLESYDVGHRIVVMDTDGKTVLVIIRVARLSNREVNLDISFSDGRTVEFIQQWDNGRPNLSQLVIEEIVSSVTNGSLTVQSSTPKLNSVIYQQEIIDSDRDQNRPQYGNDEERLCPDCD